MPIKRYFASHLLVADDVRNTPHVKINRKKSDFNRVLSTKKSDFFRPFFTWGPWKSTRTLSS